MPTSNIDTVSTNVHCKMRIYDRLRERIFDLHFAPGSALDIPRLACEMGTHNYQVFDALLRLQAEGLVEPTRDGYRLIQFDARFAKTNFEFRRSFERNAISLCIDHLNVERVEQLRSTWMQF